MPGAIAGTAILNTRGTTNNLHTVTLTINNNCNLNCPHCYLQYKSTQRVLEDNTIQSIFASDFEHLAIVGKEPLFNKESVALLEKLVLLSKNKGKTISLITNGTGLKKISTELLKKIDYIDISFDGGPLTYDQYRNSNFKTVVEGIEYLEKGGIKEINALHTISEQTINNIDDMLSVKYYGEFNKIMFSPYIISENFGKNNVNAVSLPAMLDHFKASRLFEETEEAFIFLDLFHLNQDGIDTKSVEEKIKQLGFAENKIKSINIDPLFYGIIRVTYDDLILTPYQSTHPLQYKANSTALASNSNLNKVYSQFITERLA